MRRAGGLFEMAFTTEALLAAFHDAAKSKRGKRSCFTFEQNLGTNLAILHAELHRGTYKPSPYYTFTVATPKKRIIHAPAFKDCVVQHAIYRIIYPIFNKKFIDQSFACRVGYGTHKAADYAQEALRASQAGSYTLQLDIRKFFYRINRDILQKLIARHIKDKRFVKVMMSFTDFDSQLGVPIGNLLSQIYALIYLNPLDHFIKRHLKVKKYCRYVDDMVLFDLTKKQALEYRQAITNYLESTLQLELSRSTIAKTSRGVNFVGYRTWASKRFVRRRSLYNYRRALRMSALQSVVSSMGHSRRTHTLSHFLRYARRRNYAIYCQLPKMYRRAYHLLPLDPGQRSAAHRTVHA